MPTAPEPFRFERDTLSFSNELLWVYSIDPVSGRTLFSRRHPKPRYTHRCFVLCRVVMLFYLHARFRPQEGRASECDYRHLLREVLSRSPRQSSETANRICIPGFSGLRDLSATHETLFKTECGGAWRSYLLRSHWRMVFPITRAHQSQTASDLVDAVRTTGSVVVHLVKFPRLSINHGMVIYSAAVQEDQIVFDAYDPNDHRTSTSLVFLTRSRSFQLGTNSYWSGGEVDVIQIYRNWLI